MTVTYVRLTPKSKRAVAITLDNRANQVTAACIDGGRDCARLSQRGIDRLLDGARRGWYHTVTAADLESDDDLCDDAAACWSLGT